VKSFNFNAGVLPKNPSDEEEVDFRGVDLQLDGLMPEEV